MNRSFQFYTQKKKRSYPETRLQIALLQHVRLYPMPGVLVFHVPNQGVRSAEETLRLLKMGMLSGIADLVIDVPGQPLGFLELKAAGERQEDNQRAFESWCRENGRRYAVADNIDAAMAILTDWGAVQPGCYQFKKAKMRKAA